MNLPVCTNFLQILCALLFLLIMIMSWHYSHVVTFLNNFTNQLQFTDFLSSFYQTASFIKMYMTHFSILLFGNYNLLWVIRRTPSINQRNSRKHSTTQAAATTISRIILLMRKNINLIISCKCWERMRAETSRDAGRNTSPNYLIMNPWKRQML